MIGDPTAVAGWSMVVSLCRTSAAEHHVVGGLFVNGDVVDGGDGSDSRLLLLTCAEVTGTDDGLN